MAPRQSLVHLTWRARRAAHGLSRHLPSLGAVSRVEDSLLGVGDESSSGADRGAPFGRAVSAMRSAKHRLARVWWRSELPIKGSLLAAYHVARPYSFQESRYRDTFLAVEPRVSDQAPRASVPIRIWCAWTGDNPLSDNRKRGLESIHQKNPDADIVLVTPENLEGYLVPEAPLHPIYPFLSLVHRSDYLRGYLVHHHGGAWADLKVQQGSLSGAIVELNADPGLWVVGAPIPGLPRAIPGESILERDCRHNYRLLVHGAAFAARGGTPLTTQWQAEVRRRADRYLEEARRHPGGVWGLRPNVADTQYPIPWNALQAFVFEPVCLKYHDHVKPDRRYLPQLEGHR